jgi:hypothetical protein
MKTKSIEHCMVAIYKHCISSTIIGLIKAGIIKWAGHVRGTADERAHIIAVCTQASKRFLDRLY